MHLKPGTLLQSGKYKIEKVLGQGSFGITYLATTKIKVGGNLGKMDTIANVAIKEFFMRDLNGREGGTVTHSGNGELFADYKSKFVKEAIKLSELNHPNIIKVLDLFEENNTSYYVMEYCSGGSLDNKIKRENGLNEKESVRYAMQIGKALKYMHSKKMLHLDLKPGNVVLNDKGDAVLIDFGLSKQFDSNGEPESSTTIGLGTPGYAPIEQSNYDGKGFPVTMDVYAMGATLYKMLTGETPQTAPVLFNSGFPYEKLRERNVSEDLIAIISKAMKPMLLERCQSIEEFLKALEFNEVTEDEGTDIIEIEVGPEPPGLTSRPKSWVLYVVVAILLGVAGYIMHDSKEKKEYESMLSDKQSYITLIGEGDSLLSGKKYSESINKYEQAQIYEKKYTGTEYSKEFDKRASSKISEAKARLEKERKEREGIYEVNGVTFKMIAVEGGTFKMGATSEQGSDAYSDKRPVHSVTLSDYYIGETEVTQELWDAVMGTNPSRFKGSKRPVESVSWNDCQEFITKLNNLTGKNFRLPTEAEWEYAARGGSKSKGYKYSGSNTIGNVAWYEGNSGNKTHDVKTKQANELGIYDMSGNVWEWCQDWKGDDSSSSQTNPTGPTSGSYRVYRGGSWYNNAEFCRVSYRNGINPVNTFNLLGLRLSLSQD